MTTYLGDKAVGIGTIKATKAVAGDVLHDETLVGNGNTEPLGVDKQVIATTNQVANLSTTLHAAIEAQAEAIAKTRNDFEVADQEIRADMNEKDAELEHMITEHAEELTTLRGNQASLGDQVSGIEEKIPGDASATNQLATKADLKDVGGDFVKKSGDTMTGDLAFEDYSAAHPQKHVLHGDSSFSIEYYYNNEQRPRQTWNFAGASFFASSTTGVKPFLGHPTRPWDNIYAKKLNNGADVTIPTEGGTLARIEDLTKLDSEKIDKNQGMINAGKYLAVGDDGIVGLTDSGGGGGIANVIHDSTLTGKGTGDEPLGVNTEIIATKEDVDNILPPQAGHAGDALTTNGTDVQWVKIAQNTKDFVNSSINSISAFYLTYTADGEAFPSKAALDKAQENQTFYYAGKVKAPTKNDYCLVKVDETHDDFACRYVYQEPDNQLYVPEGYLLLDSVTVASELDYLLDTGIVPTANTRIQMKYKQIKNSAREALFVGGITTEGNAFNFTKKAANFTMYCYMGNEEKTITEQHVGDTIRNYEFGNFYILDLDKNKYIFNNPKVEGLDFGTETLKCGLGQNDVLYGIKVYENDFLVCDYIPLKNKATGQVALYEKVSHTIIDTGDLLNANGVMGAVWAYQYTVNDTPFTDEQYKALNSGITADKVAQIDNKQDKLTAGSGIEINDNVISSTRTRVIIRRWE